MYELVLRDEVVDRAPLNSIEQAEIFFMKRKQMTKEQFEQIGYFVRLSPPQEKK
jgi:hypothetical protein